MNRKESWEIALHVIAQRIEERDQQIKSYRRALEDIASLYEKARDQTNHEVTSAAYDMRCIARMALLEEVRIGAHGQTQPPDNELAGFEQPADQPSSGPDAEQQR